MRTVVAHGRYLIRAGLRALLTERNCGVEILEARDSGELEAALARDQNVDLLLIDIDLPGLGGFGGLQTIHAEHSDVPIMAIGASDHEADITLAIKGGARGYVPEASSGDVFVNAIELVLSGSTYLPAPVATTPAASEKRP